jgi:hypothetical protein
MARKAKITPVKKTRAKRSSSMDKCIADAQDFINPRKAKKIVKTRTMARTLEEGLKIVHPPPVVRKTKRVQKAAVKKRTVRKSRSAVPSLPAPVAIPASTGTTLIRARSIDKSLKPSKATIFKASSKDNLPLPAFGFIDVCFCIDATGSMCSELAQVQSTIVSIIQKIESKVRT